MKKILLIIAVLVFNVILNTSSNAEVFCTQEAKLCDDWSYVSRTGPNCEFAKCPNDTSVCTLEYGPVCWEVQVQCFTAPCDPIKQTFSNMCMLKANSQATFLYKWKCKKDNKPSCTTEWNYLPDYLEEWQTDLPKCCDWLVAKFDAHMWESAMCVKPDNIILTPKIKELVDNKLEKIFNRLWKNKAFILQSAKTKLNFLKDLKPKYSELFEYIETKINNELN